MTQTPIHVSSNFFSKAARYFSNFGSAVTEVLQNAYRASLPIETTGVRPRVDVTVESTREGLTTLTVRDYGKGITDVGAALSIAVSGWDSSVEREQDPAGMGLCAALAFSNRLIISSQFGILEIEGKKFFKDAEYRDSLLEKIDPNWGCEGTEIQMIGIPSESEVIRVVEATAFYHASLDVFMKQPGQGEPAKVISFRDRFRRVLDAEGNHYKHRGYEVWEDTHPGWSGAEGVLGVIWHGQRIQVDVRSQEFRKHFKFDDIEFNATPEMRSTMHWCIAIDHGNAPVTPKLPDRNSLILDPKTVEFIWGLYQNQFEAGIRNTQKSFMEKAKCYQDGKLRVSDVCYTGCYANQEFPELVYRAFYRHYIGAPQVSWPVPSDYDNTYLTKTLLPRNARVAELASMIVLKTLDSQVLIVGMDDSCLDDTSDTSARFNFPASVPSWKPESGAATGCDVISGSWVPSGVCVSVKSLNGVDAVRAQAALMVIDVPLKLSDIATHPWGSHTSHMRANTFIRLDDGVKGEILFFDVYENFDDGLEALRDAGNTPMLFSDFAEVRSKAVRQETFSLPAFSLYYGDDRSVSDTVWLGKLDDVIALTSSVECTLTHIVQSSGEDDGETAKAIEEDFAKFRASIANVAEISRPYHEILRLCGLEGSRRDRESIASVCIDSKSRKITITHSSGPRLTTELSVDLG
jgi:hypothetical protein